MDWLGLINLGLRMWMRKTISILTMMMILKTEFNAENDLY